MISDLFSEPCESRTQQSLFAVLSAFFVVITQIKIVLILLVVIGNYRTFTHTVI